MSPPAALKLVSAPIADLKPKSLILSGSGVIPLGFVAEGDGTVVVKWASPLDPDNPNETLAVKNGRQYTCQIDKIISSDVDLLFFFGDSSAANVHLGGGSSGGGGGGGDATAANQTLALTALDAIYDALTLVGLEATNIQIRDAVTNLGDGATLADLAAAFSSDADVQADILAALQASEIDIDAIKSGIDLLVPDLDAVRVATEATSVAIGSTGDLDSANTVIGRLKNLLSRIPAALGAGGGLKIDGSGTPLPVTGAVSATVSGTQTVQGTAATGAAPSGNPVLIGGVTSAGAAVGSIRGNTVVAGTIDPFVYVQTVGSGALISYWPNAAAITNDTFSAPSATSSYSLLLGYNGTNWSRIRSDASGRLVVTNSRISRVAHLASQTLPAAGAFTSQTPYTIPEGVVGITAYVTYTRGAVGGQVALRPQYGNGTETAYETSAISSTANDGTVRNQLNLRELLGPVKDTASAVVFQIEFVVPPGCTTFALYAAEAGVTGTPGTCAIALTARYGS